MWHWLHKSAQEIDPLVRASILGSCGLHVIAMLIVCIVQVMRTTQQIAVSRNMHAHQAVTIIIDPHASTSGTIVRPHAASQAVSSSADNRRQAASTTVIATNKSTRTVTQSPKKVQKNNKAAPKKTKATPVPKKSAKPKSKPQKKNAKQIKKTDTTQKEKRKKEIQQQVVPPKVQQNEIAPQVPIVQQAVPPTASVPLGIEGPVMIARSASDAAALTVQLEIQQELLRVWHPPIGIDGDILCHVKVSIDEKGVVHTIELLKPSGVLLFDVSARAAVQQAVWPRAVWGATLELCLQ